MRKVRIEIFSTLGGITAVSKLLGITKQGVSGYLNNLKRRIPYHFAVQIAYLTGIRIEKIAPYAKEVNAIISEFLFKKSLPQVNSQKITNLTIEPTSKLGKRMIMTDENIVISGSKELKQAVKNKKELKRIVVLPINEILRGSVNLNVFEFSNIEKLLIASHLKKILKQNFVFTNATAAKMIVDIIQINFEEITNFDYLTKHASKSIIECIDSGVISVSEAYGLVKESEAEYEAETINRQQYTEYCPQNSAKRIQNIILHTEFGCAL